MSLSKISLSIHRIDMLVLNQDTSEFKSLSHGTCFIIKDNSNVFICTNKHNITGRNVFTNKLLNSDALTPTHVKVYMNYYEGLNEVLLNYATVILDLNKEHFKFHDEEFVDIAICKINPEESIAKVGLDMPKRNDFDKLVVMDKVYVPGYPDPKNSFTPLYRAGIISSEPSVLQNIDDKKISGIFLLDIITNSGQSGSPVIIEADELDEDTYFSVYSDRMKPFSIVGIYSGRHNFNKKDMGKLGIVWSSDYILDIIEQF